MTGIGVQVLLKKIALLTMCKLSLLSAVQALHAEAQMMSGAVQQQEKKLGCAKMSEGTNLIMHVLHQQDASKYKNKH